VKPRLTYILFAVVISLISCKDEEAIPAYLHLTAWEFETNSEQGSAKQIIKSAHVFVEGQSIGIYQVPITIPVVGDGDTKFTIFPVVKLNGAQEVEAAHPYFLKLDTTLSLSPMREDTLQLTSTYTPTSEFLVIEDFEGRLIFDNDLDGDALTKIEKNRTDVFEGTASGQIVLNEDHPVIEVSYDTLVTNTQGHGAYWVEITYKTNMLFVVGVEAFINGQRIRFYDAGINVKEEWNTVYFDLTQRFLESNSGLYRLAIVGLWEEDSGVEQGIIQLDNIKVVRTR